MNRRQYIINVYLGCGDEGKAVVARIAEAKKRWEAINKKRISQSELIREFFDKYLPEANAK